MKKKLKLNDLEIQSFVTSVDKSSQDALKGGFYFSLPNKVCVLLEQTRDNSCLGGCETYPECPPPAQTN